MAETTSETKSAVIRISKALLGVSFAAISAFAGANGGWVAAAAALPGAALSASDNLKPLLEELKEKKEEVLELPIPNWWSRRDDTSWQNACTGIESRLPTIVNVTAEHLKKEASPTTSVILRVFISEIEHQLPTWEINTNERSLMAAYIAKPFLEKVANILKTKIDTIQIDALIGKMDKLDVKVSEVANALATLAAQAPAPNMVTDITPAGVVSPPTQHSTANRLEQKWQTGAYDVLICYHPGDKEAVRKIDEQLKARGILPWFDSRKEPGTTTQREMIKQIKKVQAAAVFIGKDAETNWQVLQVDTLINQFVERNIRVIPVFLPDAPEKPEFSLFLEAFSGVDFRQTEPDPLLYLMWGITGVRPKL